MSKHMRDIEQAFNLRADFDEFLAAGDEENARACIDAMGEKGEELEALKMHQEFNRAFDPIVPVEQPVPPVLEAGWIEPSAPVHQMSESLEQQHLSDLSSQINRKYD